MRSSARGPKFQSKSPFEMAVRGCLRHPIYIALSLLLAAGAGYAAVKAFGKKRYTYQGKVFYSPNRVTEPYYVSPSLRDLQLAIVQSPFLREIYDEHKIQDDFLVFVYRLRFEVNGASSLDVLYTARDPELVEAVVQDSMQRFRDAARDLRRDALDGYIADFEKDIDFSTQRSVAARNKLEETLRPESLQTAETLNAEIGRLRQALVGYQTNLEAAEVRRNLSRAQVASLAKLDLADNDTTESTVSSDPQAEATGSDREQSKKRSMATYDTQMQRLLEDQINRAREDSSFQVRIDLKQREYDRAQLSLKRDLISQAAFEKIKGELEILKAQKNSQIRELEAQLADVNRRINDRTESLSVLDPGTAVTLMTGGAMGNLNLEQQTMALLEGSEKAAELNILQIRNSIENVRQDLGHLVRVKKNATPLINEVEMADQRVRMLSETADKFIRARRSRQAELTIAQNSTRLVEGEKDNYTKWFLAGFGGTLSVLLGPLALAQFFKAWRQMPDNENVFGLPVLARKPSRRVVKKRPVVAQESLRRAALRVANQFKQDSGVLAVIEDECDIDGVALVDHLCEFYTDRGVPVSIVDGDELARRGGAIPLDLGAVPQTPPMRRQSSSPEQQCEPPIQQDTAPGLQTTAPVLQTAPVPQGMAPVPQGNGAAHAYGESAQAYHQLSQAYSETTQAYNEPAQAYSEPAQAANPPNVQVHAPEQMPTAPSLGLSPGGTASMDSTDTHGGGPATIHGRMMTLVRAPLMQHPLEGETAAASADSLILVARGKDAKSPQMQRRISELSQIGTPMLGVVLED
ncbi:MAG: hypothetical protein AAF958_00515 [Planctomycetota bacterium]